MNAGPVREWRRGAWRVVADRRQVFEKDPGQGTPIMVYGPRGSSATLGCALDRGECEYVAIPSDVYRWLEEITEEVEQFVFGG